MSDRSFEDLVFYGIGQHRIQKISTVPGGDAWAAQLNGAYYAVYLNFASTLEVKPGFAQLGADAYFDRDGRVLGIVRAGKLWRPTDPAGSATVCTGRLWWHSCSYTIGWEHIKLAFRGTLSAVITMIDRNRRGRRTQW